MVSYWKNHLSTLQAKKIFWILAPIPFSIGSTSLILSRLWKTDNVTLARFDSFEAIAVVVTHQDNMCQWYTHTTAWLKKEKISSRYISNLTVFCYVLYTYAQRNAFKREKERMRKHLESILVLKTWAVRKKSEIPEGNFSVMLPVRNKESWSSLDWRSLCAVTAFLYFRRDRGKITRELFYELLHFSAILFYLLILCLTTGVLFEHFLFLLSVFFGEINMNINHQEYFES